MALVRRTIHTIGPQGEPVADPRIQGFAEGAQIPLQEGIPFYHYSHMSLRAGPLLVPTLRTAWKNDNIEPVLVILETAREVLAEQDEKEATVVRGLWQQLRKLTDEGRTVILVHHKRKPHTDGNAGEVRYTASGSQDFLAGCDWAFAASKTRDKGVSTLSFEKCRHIAEPEPFSFSIRGGPAPTAMSITLVPTPGKGRGRGPAGSWLTDHPEASLEEALTHGVSRATYYRQKGEEECVKKETL